MIDNNIQKFYCFIGGIYISEKNVSDRDNPGSMLNQFYGLTYYALFYGPKIDDDELAAINWYLDGLEDSLEAEIVEDVELFKKISRLARETVSILQEISNIIKTSPQNYP